MRIVTTSLYFRVCGANTFQLRSLFSRFHFDHAATKDNGARWPTQIDRHCSRPGSLVPGLPGTFWPRREIRRAVGGLFEHQSDVPIARRRWLFDRLSSETFRFTDAARRQVLLADISMHRRGIVLSTAGDTRPAAARWIVLLSPMTAAKIIGNNLVTTMIITDKVLRDRMCGL